ncbi:hypothetical protein, partial [Pseudomonas sp. rhizo25]|uniref:hypothetical protein n=1 Tax=Pseudomonas sp. rhizo25 TaxID=3059675 RepID=UPI00288CDB40
RKMPPGACSISFTGSPLRCTIETFCNAAQVQSNLAAVRGSQQVRYVFISMVYLQTPVQRLSSYAK